MFREVLKINHRWWPRSHCRAALRDFCLFLLHVRKSASLRGIVRFEAIDARIRQNRLPVYHQELRNLKSFRALFLPEYYLRYRTCPFARPYSRAEDCASRVNCRQFSVAPNRMFQMVETC